MIEIQIREKEKYDKLKHNASYFSDITRICQFRDEMRPLLVDNDIFNESNVFLETSYNKPAQKPTLTIRGRNVAALKGASAEMLHFVGCRSEVDPTIALKDIGRLKYLIDSDLVEVDEKFLNAYSTMSYNSKVGELICANVSFYRVGRITDKLDKDLTMRAFRFSEAVEQVVKYRQFNNLEVIGPLEISGNIAIIPCKQANSDSLNTDDGNSKQIIKIKFYGPTDILKSISFKGNIINVATKKISSFYDKTIKKEVVMINEPIIVPNGLDFSREVVYTPPFRGSASNIFADQWRMAWNEFQIRKR